MIAYEKVLLDKRRDLVVVVDNVNSTMASTLASVKLGNTASVPFCVIKYLEIIRNRGIFHERKQCTPRYFSVG